MPIVNANPDLLQSQFEWRNRIAGWRMRIDESAFLMLAALGFVGVGLWLVDPHWSRLLYAGAPWSQPLPAVLIGLGLAAALLWRAQTRRAGLARVQGDDWLAAQPIAPAARRRARTVRAAWTAASSALVLLCLLVWASARSSEPAPLLIGLLASAALSAPLLIGWLPERRQVVGSPRRSLAVAVAIPVGTSGLALLGAALEPALARLPRGASWTAGTFILLPPSTPAIAIPALMLLFTATSMAIDLVAHWRARFLADQAWLAAQPLAPARLFAAYRRPLLRRGSLLVLVAGACLHLLGAPALFAATLALALWLALADGVLCGFATRSTPNRYPLQCMLHGMLLLATIQGAWQAWRRGLR